MKKVARYEVPGIENIFATNPTDLNKLLK